MIEKIKTIGKDSFYKSCQESLKIKNYGLKITFFALFLFFLGMENAGASTIGVLRIPPSNLGLVGYWTMDGKNVNWATGKVTDSSGQGNTGYVVGMATSTAPAIGKIGQALKFDGVDDYIALGNPSSLNFTISPFTISAQVYLDNIKAGGYAPVVAKSNGSSSWQYAIRFNQSSAQWAFRLWNTAGTGTTFNGVSLTLKKWTHIVAVYDKSNVTLYTDNIANAPVSYSSNLNASTNVSIGKYFDSSANNYWNGLIDEVRIYNRALGANEITALYNSGATKFAASPTNSLTSGLVGYWTMDGKNVNWATGKVTDSSGQGNTGYVVGMATSTAPAIGKIGQALKFDGVDDYVNAGTNSSLNITGTAITISAWIKPITFGGSSLGRIVNKQTSANVGYLFFIDNVNRVNSLGFAINDATAVSGTFADTVANTISLNQWQHVSVVYNGTGVYFYINNVLQTNFYNISGKSISNNSSLPFYIGSRSADALRQFNGLIDDVRIYNRALTAQEVSQLYNMGKAIIKR